MSCICGDPNCISCGTGDDYEVDCDHVWKQKSDWIGDFNVINGTKTVMYWQCEECGDITQEQPDDWQPYDPDYAKERQEDF